MRLCGCRAAARGGLAPPPRCGAALPGVGFGFHFRPVALEFLGDELREARERPLTHLRARDADHNLSSGAITTQASTSGAPSCARGRRDAEWPSAGRSARPRRCGGGADDEGTAIHFMASPLRPCAAVWIAAPDCADRCRSGRCWSSRRRCPRRSASASREQRRRRHELARLAIAALRHVVARPRPAAPCSRSPADRPSMVVIFCRPPRSTGI